MQKIKALQNIKKEQEKDKKYEHVEDELKTFDMNLKEIQNLFKNLNGNDNFMTLSRQKLQDILKVMNMDDSEYNINRLLQGQNEITSEQLFQILTNQNINEDFVFNEVVQNLGFEKNSELNCERVNEIFEYFNFEKVSKKNIQLLKEVFDESGDGKINSEDLKIILQRENIKK